MLGEMALVLRQERSAGCVVLTKVLTLKLDREPFQELLSQSPAIALEVIKMLADRLDQAQQAAQTHKD